MTEQEFIEKWNVAYESKEQQLEFAQEMQNDLLSLLNKEEKEKLNDDFVDLLYFYQDCPNVDATTPIFEVLEMYSNGKKNH